MRALLMYFMSVQATLCSSAENCVIVIEISAKENVLPMPLGMKKQSCATILYPVALRKDETNIIRVTATGISAERRNNIEVG